MLVFCFAQHSKHPHLPGVFDTEAVVRSDRAPVNTTRESLLHDAALPSAARGGAVSLGRRVFHVVQASHTHVFAVAGGSCSVGWFMALVPFGCVSVLFR